MGGVYVEGAYAWYGKGEAAGSTPLTQRPKWDMRRWPTPTSKPLEVDR